MSKVKVMALSINILIAIGLIVILYINTSFAIEKKKLNQRYEGSIERYERITDEYQKEVESFIQYLDQKKDWIQVRLDPLE